MRSFTVTSVWGIPIRVNVSLVVFLPVLAWLIGSGGQIDVYAGAIESLTGAGLDRAALTAGATPWVIGVVAAVGLFVSVTLHELGHSWVALRYGLEIESITLWILGGIASLREMPREWDRELWIAIAGPATSVGVGIACLAGLSVVPEALPVGRFVLGWLGIVNLTLAAFNLLPAFPMDGGRILRAVLARNRPYASATRIAGRVGVVFALLFAVVGVMSFNVLLILLALFVYGAATTESKTVLIDELLEGLTVGTITSRDPGTVGADTAVAALVDRMIRDRRTAYPVTDDAGVVVGLVSLGDLRRARQRDPETTTVGSLARDVPRVGPDADAFETLALLNHLGAEHAIIEEAGALIGVLSNADYAHALTVRRGFAVGVPG